MMMTFFDGAFGTYYFARKGDETACELANLNDPDEVLAIHREYIHVGVNAIKTNTFNANPTLYDQSLLTDILTQGYRLAMQAARDTGVAVFADIGNIESHGEPGHTAALYTQVADIFIELGATHFLFETLCEFDAIVPALAAIRARVANATVLVSFAVSQDGFSRRGLPYKTLIDSALRNPHVDIVGLNCVCGPMHIYRLTKELGPIAKPLSIMPNAGYPSLRNGRTVFQDNAEYFAERLVAINQLGVDIIGGCCGTTPKHIALTIQAIAAKNQPKKKPAARRDTSAAADTQLLPLKPLFVELDPPIDGDCRFILDAVDRLRACGVTTITLADSPLAKSRADSILTAARVRSEKNIDVLPHMTCRDKNHIAIKGSLLGARFFDIDKVLVVTGDPVYHTVYKRAGVFDFNAMQLISYINSLNADVFSDHPFSIGGALNVNALHFDNELARCRKKVENGAGFLLTQPIFTPAAVENFKKAKAQLDCKLYAGILPVAGYKNAVFLQNEVSGIEIPPDVLQQLKHSRTGQGNQVSIAFSKDIIRRVYDEADGFYVMTPLKKVRLVCELIQGCFDV